MALWTRKMCVRGYDSSKKTELHVKTNRRSLDHALADLKTQLRVEQMVMEDCRLTVKQIAANAGISIGSVDTILHDDLKMRKVSARWVPQMLTDENKVSRVPLCQAMLSRDKGMNNAFFSSIVTMDETWMPMFNPETKRQSAQLKHTDSPPPKKFRVSTSAEEMMVAMFWDSEGVTLTHCVPKSTTVTGGTYEDVLRKKFLPALLENGPKSCSCFFHYDNTPHRAARIHQLFNNNNFEVVPHAPYSPNLAPSDFWLFPTLKDTFRFCTFSGRSALATAIFQWSQQTPKEAFALAMQSWRQCCEKCVCLQGDYVEK